VKLVAGGATFGIIAGHATGVEESCGLVGFLVIH